MQNLPHILEQVFELSILFAVLLYLGFWMEGRKLTNRQVFFLSATTFAGLLLLNLLEVIVPTYALLIFGLPLLFSPLRTLLNSKPASRVKSMFGRKPPELAQKADELEMAKWEKIRQRGMLHFVFVRGGIGWGLWMTALFFLLSLSSIPISLLVFPITGCLMHHRIWQQKEDAYFERQLAEANRPTDQLQSSNS